MSTSLQWDDEIDSLLCLSVSGSPTARELYDLIQSLYFTIDTRQTPVDLLIRLDKTCELPQGFFAVINHYERRRHPNTRLLVVITSHPMMRIIHNILIRAEYTTPYLAEDTDDAYQYIRQFRSQLGDNSN